MALREAIGKSRRDVPRPSNWDSLTAPLLAAAGVKSWLALARIASMCEVAADKDEFVFTPTRNGGTTGPARGNSELTEDRLVIPYSLEDDKLGEALAICASRCQ
jgi:hypothetical protein